MLSEQRTEDPGFHVSDVVEVLHGVEGLRQVLRILLLSAVVPQDVHVILIAVQRDSVEDHVRAGVVVII